MTQYLIKTTTHTTGEVFKEVVKVRDNEKYEIVTGQSLQEINKRVMEDKHND